MTSRITIGIPTYDRYERLRETLASLSYQTHGLWKAIVYMNGSPPELLHKMTNLTLWDPRIYFYSEDERIGWVKAQNNIAQMYKGFFFYGADDIVLEPDCLFQAMCAMRDQFPDGDGLIGVNQINFETAGLPCWPGAFGLVGEKFLDRFPSRNLFCEDYMDHYSDVELVQYAESIGKFYYCKKAHVHHFHPMVTKTMDATAKIISKTHKAMRSRYVMRQAYGYLWGKNFNLVGKSPEEILMEAKG
jgi:GT2 family glycosyltransferase